MTARKASKEFWKRANTSCDLSHMGRNKKFYSAKYQRDLKKSERRIKN